MNNYLTIAIILFWAGFMSSISFMEAWLKFTAEGVTLNIGLSIGRKIFRALNRMEWLFLAVYGLFWIFLSKTFSLTALILSILLLVILMTQTFYLLPRLDKRIDLILKGENVAKSSHHIYFVTMEFLKVSLLIVLSAWWWAHFFPAA